MSDKIQKYVCDNCKQYIPSMINEDTGSISPCTKTCPNCKSENIIMVLEDKKEDNRQILFS